MEIKIDDTSNFTPEPEEAPRVSKNYVFEEGELFIPTVNTYEDRIVYSPYVVHKRFSIEEMVNKFKDHLDPGSYLVEENTNKLLDLMKEQGYISLQVSVKSYPFGDYHFLGEQE